MSDRLIRLGHSPDPDDAFMFYALAKGRSTTDGYRFEHVLARHRDAEPTGPARRAGGDRAVGSTPTRTCPTATRCCRRRRMGDGYGPMVVAREPLDAGRPARPARRRPGHAAPAPSSQLQLAWGGSRPRRGALRPDPRRGRGRRGATRAWSSTRASSPTRRRACSWWSTWASGGTSRPAACRCRSAPTPCAATSDEGDTIRGCQRLLRAEHRLRPGAPRRRRSTHAGVRPRPRPRRRPTASWACTSTTGRSTTASDGRAAVAELLRRGHEAGLIARPRWSTSWRTERPAGSRARLGRRDRPVDRALPVGRGPARALRDGVARGLDRRGPDDPSRRGGRVRRAPPGVDRADRRGRRRSGAPATAARAPAGSARATAARPTASPARRRGCLPRRRCRSAPRAGTRSTC